MTNGAAGTAELTAEHGMDDAEEWYLLTITTIL